MNRKKTLLLTLILVSLFISSTLIVSMAADTEPTATTMYFEVYTQNPSTSGATPAYTETASAELVTKLQEYVSIGDTWIVLYSDVTLTLSSRYTFTNSLYIDLRGHKLTMASSTSDNALSPVGTSAQNLQMKNGTLTTAGSKVLYPTQKSTAAPQILFDNMNIEVTHDFADYRAGGSVTFNECVISFTSNYATDAYCHRFMFLGQYSDIGKVTVNVIDCEFNVSTGFRWSTGDGALFNCSNKFGIPVELNVSGTTFNLMGSQLQKLFANGSAGIAEINVSDTRVNGEHPLLVNGTGGTTVMNIGEGFAFRKAAVDSIINSATLTVNYPVTDAVLAYVDAELVEYVSPEDAVTVNYYNGGEKLGERYSKVGTVPVWDIVLGMDYYEGTLCAMIGKFYTNPELTIEATVITKDSTSFYIGSQPGQAFKWAAFSSDAPSLDTLVCYSFDSDEIIEAVYNTEVAYIEAYSDVKLTHTAKPYGLTRALTIDAKGHELNLAADHTDKAFNPQTGSYLAIKNATIVSTASRLLYPGAQPNNVTTDILFENVIVDWTCITMMDYRAGGSFTARGCEFNFNGSTTHAFYLMHARSELSLDMLFENCSVKVNGTLTSAFINISSGATNCTVNAEFNGCSFDMPSGTAIFNNQSATSVLNVTINGKDASAPTYINSKIPVIASSVEGQTALAIGNDVYLSALLDSGFVQNVTPIYKDGVRAAHASDSVHPYVITDDYVTVTFHNDGVTTTEDYHKGYVGSLKSARTYTLVEKDGVKTVAELGTEWQDFNGNTVTVFTPTDGMVLTGSSAPTGRYATWVIFNGGETEVIAHSFTDSSIDGVLPADLTARVGAGCVLRLYADMMLTASGTGVQGLTMANGSVIDLGGHTLTMTNARFQTASASNHGFTVKNGTVNVVQTSNNILFSNVGAKGNTVFEDVTFVVKDGMPCFDIRGGSLYLTDCEYDGSSKFMAISARYSVGAPIYILVDGCNIKSADAFYINCPTSGNPPPPFTPDVDLTVRDTEVECGYLFTLNGTVTEDSVIDLFFEDIKVKSIQSNLFYLGVDTLLNITFGKGCMFNINPLDVAGGNAPDSVSLPDGLSVIEKGEGDYVYSIGVPVYLKWNMTLYTDFNINFFLRKEGINSVKVNGEDYPLSEMLTVNENYVFTLDSMSADRVADNFEIEIGYGDGYSVTYTKSVVDYATDILDSDHTDTTKQLIASAMNYIHKAYVYAKSIGSDSTVPEALTELMSSELYLAYAPTGEVDLGDSVDIGDINAAFVSAQFNLTSRIKLRLNLKSDYTGTVTIGDQTFTVADGISVSTGTRYVETELDAFVLYDSVIVVEATVGDGISVGRYSLATYIAAIKDTVSSDAKDLLSAIAHYSADALTYKTEKNMLDNFTYEKNGNTYVITGVKNDSGALVIPERYEGLYVTEIAAYAFRGRTGITSVSIPSSVRVIGVSAFDGCTSITELTLSEGLEVIGARAFFGTAVESLVIPDSVEAIGMGALLDCNNLKSITVPFVGAYSSNSNNYFGYIFGAPSYVANNEYVPESLKTVILSDNATRVPAYSFFGCENISEVILGSGVDTIGISAFSSCNTLTTIYIPVTVKSIPAAGYYYNSPFFGCSDELVIVTETEDLSTFGSYWSQLSESKSAEVVSGKSYDEYLAEYK